MKKVILVLISAVCMCSFPLTVQAAEYGTDFPDYVKYSGGAYIEVQCSIGRGTIVLQDSYKTGYIGFYSDSYNLCNLSNSTLTGKFVSSNGTIYNCRFSSYTIPQYYYESGVTHEWRNLNTTKIYNTNCEFIDLSDRERSNVIDVFDNNTYQYTVVGFLILLCITDFIFLFRLVRS